MPYFDENGNYVTDDGRVVDLGLARAANRIPGPFGQEVEAPPEPEIVQPAPEIVLEPELETLPVPGFVPEQEAPVPAPFFQGVPTEEPLPEPAPESQGAQQIGPPVSDPEVQRNAGVTSTRTGRLVEAARLGSGSTDAYADAADQTLNAQVQEDALARQALNEQSRELAEGAVAEEQLYDSYRQNVADAKRKEAELVDAVENRPIGEDAVWEKKGNLTKVMSILSVMFGAVGMRASGGRNLGLEIVNNMVDREIDAQKARLAKDERALERMPREYARIEREYNSERAKDAAKRALAMKSIATRLEAEMHGLPAQSRALAARQLAHAQIMEKARGYVLEADKHELGWATLEQRQQLAQLRAMAKAGKGGGAKKSGGVLVDPSNWRPPTGQIRAEDGSIVKGRGLDLTKLGKERQTAIMEGMSGAQGALDAVAAVKRIKANPHLWGAKKAASEQQVAFMLLEAMKNVPGIPSDKDMDLVRASQGGDPGALKRYLQGSHADTIRRLESFAKAQVSVVNNQLGGPEWTGAVGRADRVLKGVLSPEQIEADAAASRAAGSGGQETATDLGTLPAEGKESTAYQELGRRVGQLEKGISRQREQLTALFAKHTPIVLKGEAATFEDFKEGLDVSRLPAEVRPRARELLKNMNRHHTALSKVKKTQDKLLERQVKRAKGRQAAEKAMTGGLINLAVGGDE